MAIKITDLNAQDVANPWDWLLLVDHKDEAMSEWGTNKKIAVVKAAESMIDMIPSSYFLNKKIVGYTPGIEGPILEGEDTILTTFSKLQSAIDTKAPILNPSFNGTVILPPSTFIGDVDATEISYLDGLTENIQDQLDSKAPINDPTFTGTVIFPANSLVDPSARFVPGTLTAQLIAGALEYNGTKLYITNHSVTPLRDPIATESYVSQRISNLIDNAPDALDTLNELAAAIADDSNYATAITTALATKAPKDSPTFTGAVILPAITSIGPVSDIEIGYLNGVLEPIQGQINGKAPLNGPVFSGIVSLPSTTSIGLVDSTEISYLNGATSNIQSQINGIITSIGNANYHNPIFTGTVTLPTGNSLVPPVKIGSGMLTTTAVSGAIEYDGANLYVSSSGIAPVRKQLATTDHIHGNITAAGAIGTDAGKPIITTTSGVLQTGSFGSQQNTFCAGDDTRIYNYHTHIELDSATYSIVAADNNKYIRCKNTTSTALTIDATTSWTVGMIVYIRRTTNAGALSLTVTGGTINDNDIVNILPGEVFGIRCISIASTKVFDFI
jgi:hypothetical protein